MLHKTASRAISLLNWKKLPAAIFSDIAFVTAGKRRGFCRLRSTRLR
jgi:hypothetical protein